jgi:hypothetical protein
MGRLSRDLAGGNLGDFVSGFFNCLINLPIETSVAAFDPSNVEKDGFEPNSLMRHYGQVAGSVTLGLAIGGAVAFRSEIFNRIAPYF